MHFTFQNLNMRRIKSTQNNANALHKYNADVLRLRYVLGVDFTYTFILTNPYKGLRKLVSLLMWRGNAYVTLL